MFENAPFSALVCGVQGSGKSHTVSVILESMMVANCPSAGLLNKALSGLVLHFGEGGPSSLPSEAAWLSMANSFNIKPPEVRVFVSQSSLNTMKTVYAPLGGHIIVEPLIFSESELDAQAFLSMMAIGGSESAPLYIQVILTILRDLGENYTFNAFTQELEKQKKKFNPSQLSGLEQRMSLLTSFLAKDKKSRRHAPTSRFAAGRLTIIDLSDPFIDPASACGLFEIIVRLFVRSDVDTGKVLVVDEAHKVWNRKAPHSPYLSFWSLVSVVQSWIIGTDKGTFDVDTPAKTLVYACHHQHASDAFDKVVKLHTGQAVVLAPSALATFASSTSTGKVLDRLGRRYLIMKTRKRVTQDGGESILVI
ncbi:hypothetical protein C0992_000049 [Termitomyces sp. T32_za158]|nr:hypothetical protein C0992_000049 [Termitomyces sp. T32_za158]